ncbi:30S ribosomal protein S3 [Rickettsiales bacterium (ex Bugula neritina AB1)]|nr:30S ribosomal protein S3 [Rickettsiales bacterium (ex Bugula neritina AB1)]
MGNKVNPDVMRVELNSWKKCRWFSYSKKKYCDNLQQDIHIRDIIKKNLSRDLYSYISITRVNTKININIHTHRPAAVVNLLGNLKKKILSKVFNVDKSQYEKKKYENKIFLTSIVLVTKPELDPNIIANNIARQIENRVPCKIAMRKELSHAMRNGALGIKIQCSGRVEGASIARTEKIIKGNLPQHTFRLDIRKTSVEANTVYGIVGVTVIINIPKNTVLERNLSPRKIKTENKEGNKSSVESSSQDQTKKGEVDNATS